MISAALALAACFLNKEDFKTILFCLFILVINNVPFWFISNYYLWYAAVIAVEILILVHCFVSNLRVSVPLIPLSFLLISAHIINFCYMNLANYYVIVNFLETMQMVSFIITSQPIITRIKGRMKCLQKYGCGY